MSDSQTDSLPPQNSSGDARTRSSYWMDDGNIVLQAENTLFRLHRSILSRHSQVFSDMFAIPHASSQEAEHIEDCPVITLSDTAEDVGNIISLLYDNDKALRFGLRALPVSVLGSMLRLGRKYAIAHIENEALEALHHDYPTVLRKWDTLTDDRLRIEPIPTELICIAHEFGLFTVLPAVYVSYLQTESLMSILNESDIPKQAVHDCVTGYVKFMEFAKQQSVDALCPPLILPSKGCTGIKCDTKKWETIKCLPVWRVETLDILDTWDVKIKNGLLQGLCSQCQGAAKTLTNKVRSECWSRLPEFFGLPAWSDLKDEI